MPNPDLSLLLPDALGAAAAINKPGFNAIVDPDQIATDRAIKLFTCRLIHFLEQIPEVTSTELLEELQEYVNA